MTANTYTYTGPGTRWAVEDPTAVDYLNVARINADHLHEALNTVVNTANHNGLKADVTVNGTALDEYIADTIGAMVTGTETGISVSYDDSDNTLDFVVGTLNQDTTGTAALATSVTASANNSTDETVYPTFVDGATGTQGIETDTGLTYNPSTGLLSSAGVTASGTVTYDSLSDGSITITGFVDEDDMSSNSATLVPTQQSVKAYVDSAGGSNATTVTITDNENTNETNAIVFTAGGDVDGGNLGLESDGDLTYNPSSGLLSATAVTATGAVNTGALTSTGNISFDGGSFVFNESGADKDFRIEGDTNVNLFVADASEDKIGFGTATPGPGFVTLGGGVAATTIRIDIDGGSDNGKGAQIAFRSGGSDKFYVGDTASLQGGSESSRDMSLYTTSGCGIRFYTGGNNRRMDITSDGDLQMAAGSDITQATGNDMNFKVSVNRDIIFGDTAEILRFKGDGGKVGIGEPNPEGALHINTSLATTGGAAPHANRNQLVLENYAAHAGMTIISGHAHSGYIAFSDNVDGGGAIEYSQWANVMVLYTNSGERLRLDNVGGVYINESENADMTVGLTINQGANDDQALAFKSSDVTHGITDIVQTDTYFEMRKLDSDRGGVRIDSYIETGADYSMVFRGIVTDSDATRSTSGVAPVTIQASLKSSATIGSMGSDKNIVAFRDHGTTRFVFDSDGDSHQDVGTAWTNFDDEDDAMVCRSVGIVMDQGSIVRSQFDDWSRDHKEDLIRTGLIQRLSSEEEDAGGRPLMNTTQLARLHNGAIWQLHERIETLQLQLHEATDKLARMEMN